MSDNSLRRHLIRQFFHPETTSEGQLAIESVLTSQEQLDQLHQSIADNIGAVPVDPGPVIANQHPILAWLWQHREEIMKFVMSIVALFSAVGS